MGKSMSVRQHCGSALFCFPGRHQERQQSLSTMTLERPALALGGALCCFLSVMPPDIFFPCSHPAFPMEGDRSVYHSMKVRAPLPHLRGLTHHPPVAWSAEAGPVKLVV